MKILHMNDAFSRHFQGKDPFAELAALNGKVYRQLSGRKTFQFDLAGRSYFAKLHFGIGWQEIFKNLVLLRLPIVGARNEWQAIGRLQELGIATMTAVAYGEEGLNPATRKSFIVTEALQDTISLEDFCLHWQQQAPAFSLKRQLIIQLAQTSRTLHSNGICHRDYYLCHFLLHLQNGLPRADLRMSLIDLHRALLRRNLGRRWIVKDLAGLYYSALHIGLTNSDLLRFIRCYEQQDLRTALTKHLPFWNEVNKRAVAMFKKRGPAR